MIDKLTIVNPPYPGTPLSIGSTGSNVSLMQTYLNAIRNYYYPSMNVLKVDGIFGTATQTTVKQYQTIKGLQVDGIIGRNTWNAIVTDYMAIPSSVTDIYPGTPLTYGSTGAPVMNMQMKLNEVAPTYTAINVQKEDAIFGTNMANATRRFQKQFGLKADEVIGEQTWYSIVGVHTNVKASTPSSVQTSYPGTPVQYGDSGDSVRFVQSYMDKIGRYNGAGFPIVKIDGIFGNQTKALVLAFQGYYGLKQDGIVGPNTWSTMITEFNNTL